MSDATRDDFLPFTERVVTKYHLPSMEKDVYLQSITQQELIASGGAEERTAKLIAYSLVNENGVQLYSPKSTDDIETLKKLRSGIASELTVLIDHHNGLRKSVEDMLGNSNASPSDE